MRPARVRQDPLEPLQLYAFFADSGDMTNTAQPTERRSVPRSSAFPCPHCGSSRISAHHLRDTGDLDPALAVELGYCPKLVEKRNPVRSIELCPTDAREAARLDEWSARLTDDDMASAFAAALAGEAPR